jgi:adenylyltransferase/sulfurtransferase
VLNDQELLRYSRQILLPHVDIDGQLRLKQGRVLIIGLGGLGAWRPPVSASCIWQTSTRST